MSDKTQKELLKLGRRSRKKKNNPGGDPGVVLLKEHNGWKAGDVGCYQIFNGGASSGTVQYFREFDYKGKKEMCVVMWDDKSGMYRSGFASMLTDKTPPKKKRTRKSKKDNP